MTTPRRKKGEEYDTSEKGVSSGGKTKVPYHSIQGVRDVYDVQRKSLSLIVQIFDNEAARHRLNKSDLPWICDAVNHVRKWFGIKNDPVVGMKDVFKSAQPQTLEGRTAVSPADWPGGQGVKIGEDVAQEVETLRQRFLATEASGR